MAPRPKDVLRFVARSSKRIAVSVVGGVFVLAGLAMLVLPGPGVFVLVIGFAILGTEYTWAAAMLERTKRAAEATGRAVKAGAAKAGRGAQRAVRRATARRNSRLANSRE
jgi:hypothetical protein